MTPRYVEPWYYAPCDWIEDNLKNIGVVSLVVTVIGLHCAISCQPVRETELAEGLRLVLRDCKDGLLDKELYSCDTVQRMLDKEIAK